jgi:hypothetical protein
MCHEGVILLKRIYKFLVIMICLLSISNFVTQKNNEVNNNIHENEIHVLDYEDSGEPDYKANNF